MHVRTKYYITVLALVGLIGIGLCGLSGHFDSQIEDFSVNQLLAEIQKTAALNFEQVSQITAFTEHWKQHLAHASFWTTLIRDVGIAMMLAVILTVVIEFWARQRLQDEIREGVLEATFRRLIPPQIFDEIRNGVLLAKSVKRQWQLVMTVSRDATLNGPDPRCYASQTSVTYRIHNLTNSAYEETFSTELNRDIEGSDQTGSLPRFDWVRIGNKKYTDEELKDFLAPDGHSYTVSLTLPRDPSYLEVRNEFKEVLRVPDTFVWSMTGLTEDVSITIESTGVPEIGFEVNALHPDRKRLERTGNGRWDFQGVVLPWQGFEIRSFVKPVSTTAHPVAVQPTLEASPNQIALLESDSSAEKKG